MRTLGMAFGVMGLLLASPYAARANGRFPATNQLVPDPGNPSRIVVRTTFGVLVSPDAGRNWDWICESAYGKTSDTDPPLALVTGGRIMLGLFNGLRISTPDGCGFESRSEFASEPIVVDVTTEVGDANRAYALTSTFAGASDGGGWRYDNRVHFTADGGASWQTLGPPLADDALLETLDAAPSDANRLYVTGVRAVGDERRGVLFRSDNHGTNWNETPIPLPAVQSGSPYLAAVDPGDPDRLYVRTTGGDLGTLLVSKDGGASFELIYSGSNVTGFALLDQGKTLAIGTPTSLGFADKDELVIREKSQIRIQCLTAIGDTLYACSSESFGFTIGRSLDRGATFESLLHLDGIRGPLPCASGSTAACEAEWPALRDLLSGKPPDAGPGFQPADAGLRAFEPTGGCSCRQVPSAGGAALPVALGLMMAALFGLRQRRRRRRTRTPNR